MKRAPMRKIWHPEYSTEKCSCVPIKLFRHLEWNTPGSSRWYMRRISNGCYRHFVDTKPCRWEKPKSIKKTESRTDWNRTTNRTESDEAVNYIHYSLTWCHRQVLYLSLLSLVQRLLKFRHPHDLIYVAHWEISANFLTTNSFSKTLYQLNLLYLKYRVAATLSELLSPSRRNLTIDVLNLLVQGILKWCIGEIQAMSCRYPGVEVRPTNYLSTTM